MFGKMLSRFKNRSKKGDYVSTNIIYTGWSKIQCGARKIPLGRWDDTKPR